MVYRGMRHTYQVFSSCKYTSLIKWTQSATFTATKLRRGMIFTRIRGGGGIVQLWAMGEKSMCHHPVWIAQLPLSYPTTTLTILMSSWGSYCLGVGVAGFSVLTHSHTPPALGTSCWAKEVELRRLSTLSTILLRGINAPAPPTHDSPLFVHPHARTGLCSFLMHRHLFCLISCSHKGGHLLIIIHVFPHSGIGRVFPLYFGVTCKFRSRTGWESISSSLVQSV